MTATRTIHRNGEARVNSWVHTESWGYKSGIELGCGVGVYTRAMVCFDRAGIDAFEPYITEAMGTEANKGIEFILGDMREFESLVRRDYDFCLIVDALEHITKADALDLIARCQQKFLKIALFVPIGLHDQEPCDDNEMQRHLSTWYPADLTELGFEVDLQLNFHNGNPPDKQGAAFARWVKP